MPQSPLFGKPLSEQHVYLPYYEGQKMQMHTRKFCVVLHHPTLCCIPGPLRCCVVVMHLQLVDIPVFLFGSPLQAAFVDFVFNSWKPVFPGIQLLFAVLNWWNILFSVLFTFISFMFVFTCFCSEHLERSCTVGNLHSAVSSFTSFFSSFFVPSRCFVF